MNRPTIVRGSWPECPRCRALQAKVERLRNGGSSQSEVIAKVDGWPQEDGWYWMRSFYLLGGALVNYDRVVEIDGDYVRVAHASGPLHQTLVSHDVQFFGPLRPPL